MEQILIVEDDSFLNKMLDYNLTADGYGVTSTLNARTAAEAIRQREFDLVLLDISTNRSCEQPHLNQGQQEHIRPARPNHRIDTAAKNKQHNRRKHPQG